MRKKLLTYQLFLLLHPVLIAQDISINVEYPSVVEAGKQFNVMWIVNAGGGEFSAPAFTGFYKLMGPQTSYSSSTEIRNGKMTQQITNSYVYYLQALEEGKYVIPPAVFTLKNKTYVSDSMYIEVVGNSTATQPGRQEGSSEKVENAGGEVFLNLSLNRKEVFVGEHIIASVKLYTKVNLSGINEIKYPSFTGFLRTDLETPPLTSLTQENVNGTVYGTGVLQEFVLYPQISGEITIEPVQLSVLIRQQSGQSDPFFGDFFTTYNTVPKAVISQPAKIKVKPLPEPRPPDFSGLVGKVNIKAAINKDTVTVNDAVNFRITLAGSGNLKLAASPKMNLSSDIEVYDPKITDEIKNSVNGTSGQKTFEYLLIPRHHGDFIIPAVTYSNFNPSTGKYEQLTTGEFKFHARKGQDQNSEITVFGGVSKEDVRYVGRDIRFIKTEPGRLKKFSKLFVSGRTFYSIYTFALLAFFIILFIRREHIKRNSDLSAVRNRKAGKVAVRRLHSAAACLKNGETDRMYEEILKAVWGYLSDKLNIPVSELTRNTATEALRSRGIGEDRINDLIGILDNCEYARYAPSSGGTEAASAYESASGFIKSIENNIAG